MKYRRLRRPRKDSGAEAVAKYRREVAVALEELGVGFGEEFLIIPLSVIVDGPKARGSDPDTSKTAALRNEPKRGSQRAQIVELLVRERGGKTASDVAERLSIPLNSISTRMSELVRGGWIDIRGTREQAGSERSLYVPTAMAVDVYGGRAA